jgi:hypothetical protein
MYGYQICVLGVGGHGAWEPLRNFLQKENCNFIFISPPCDWGGYTGEWGRRLEQNNGELNILLHKQQVPIYPWGDFNKPLAYYLGKNISTQAKDAFKARSSNYKTLRQNFEILAKALDLKEEIIHDFKVYLKTTEDYCNKNNSADSLEDFKSDRSGSLAHFWNSFLYARVGSMEAFNDFYHQKKVLPKNIHLRFAAKERMILKGTDALYRELDGEDEIDKHSVPIAPPSLRLFKKNGRGLEKSDLQDILDIIQTSDLVILPNGSMANSIPLVNESFIAEALRDKSKQKRLLMMMNLFRTPCEQEFYIYPIHLANLGIYPIILGPEIQTHILNVDILRTAYELQRKAFNSLARMSVRHYYATLQIITQYEDKQVEGVKYKPESVTEAIETFLR